MRSRRRNKCGHYRNEDQECDNDNCANNEYLVAHNLLMTSGHDLRFVHDLFHHYVHNCRQCETTIMKISDNNYKTNDQEFETLQKKVKMLGSSIVVRDIHSPN